MAPISSILPWIMAHWELLILVLLAILFLGLIGWWFWRRYGTWVLGAWREFRRQPEIQPDCLVNIWREFKRDIPRGLRRFIEYYPIYLVMGDDRAGKSTLIRNCAYSDTQELRDHPSYDEDNLMQVYLGNEAVIIELSASFLHVGSRDHVDALLNLWRKLPHNSKLVLALNAHAMLYGDTEHQARIGDALMGKLALFSEVNEAPVQFSLVLTHMDLIEGFSEFHRFSLNYGMDFQVSIENARPVARFSDGLETYHQFITNILISCETTEFTRILKFLGSANQTLGALQSLIDTGCLRNGLEDTLLERVCLVSDGGSDQQIQLHRNNPFLHSPIKRGTSWEFSSKHLKRASILAVFCLSWQIIGFVRERMTLSQAANLIREMPAILLDQYSGRVHPVFRALYPVSDNEVSIHADGIFHFSYYPEQANIIRRSIDKAIRTFYLIPKLELAQNQDHVYTRTIELLALLHANKKNEMGRIFSDKESQKDLDIPEEVIADYIEFNDDLDDPQLLELQAKNYGVFKVVGDGFKLLHALGESLRTIEGTLYLKPKTLDSLQAAARNITSWAEQKQASKYLDEERIWLENYGHISPLTLQQWQNFPSYTQLHSKDIRDTLDLVLTANITTFKIPDTITEVMSDIRDIMKKYKDESAGNNRGILTAHIAGSVYTFDSNHWNYLIYRSKIRELLQSYYMRSIGSDGWIFFDRQSRPFRIPLGISTDESGVLTNNAQVDVRLTRDGFEQNVKPAIEALSGLIEDIPLEQADKQILVDFFVRNLATYTGNYFNAYWSFFRNIVIRISGIDQLTMYLHELQRPGSAFVQNLIRINDNVKLDIPPSQNYQLVRERLQDFLFMKKLMTEQAGSYPELNRYIALVADMNDQLTADTSDGAAVKDKSDGKDSGLKALLNPIGRVALDMIQGTESSYLRKVDAWIKEMSIPSSWRGPFLIPFQKVLEFGRQDINRTIENNWQQLWDRQVLPLLGKFPFERDRLGNANEITPEQLTAVFHPVNGVFWQEAKRNYSSLFDVTDGKWVAKPELVNSISLPDNMEDRLNAASRLSQYLWTKDAQNAPLIFKVKADLIAQPTPIPADEDNPVTASLNFLRSSSHSALGFNQRSYWQELPFDWWQKASASVGLEFKSLDEKFKRQASQEVNDVTWPLLRLLRMATRKDLQYTWLVSLPEAPEQKLRITYTFKRDPFEIFQSLNRR